MIVNRHWEGRENTGSADLSNLQPYEILNALTELERASADHAEWLKDWHLAVVFAGSAEIIPNNRKFDPQHPTFRAWITGEASRPFRNLPLFEQIETSLDKMLRQAKVLARAAKNHKGIPSVDYDLFMSSVIHLNELTRQLQSETWNRLASVDPLTGVRNRNTMMAVMDAERSRSERTNQACTLALMDLDHFKEINDTYGHPAGDIVLKAVADVVQMALRPYDHVFRYGGDEFLICLPNTDTDTAHLVLDRLRARIGEMEISAVEKTIRGQTVSIGIALITANSSLSEAIQHTDDALYSAKKTGRNTVTIASEPESGAQSSQG